MKKILAFLLLSFTLAINPPPASALVLSSQTSIYISPDETITDDVFAAGESVTIEGTIQGDLYAAGSNVKVTGTVTGDVFAAGGTVVISGADIGQDLRLAGGTVTVTNTQVADNATLFGGSLSLVGDTAIAGSFSFAGGNVLIESPVSRNLYGAGGMVNLDAPVELEAQIAAGSLTLGSNAAIGGDFTYSSDGDLSLSPTASVAGEIIEKTPQFDREQVEASVETAARTAAFGFTLWSFLASLLIGLLLHWLFPRLFQDVTETIVDKPLATFGWGALSFFAIFPLFLLLVMTVIGIPLAFILVVGFFILVYLAKLFVAPALGHRIFYLLTLQPKNRYYAFIVGLLAITIFLQLPFLGGLIWLVVAFMGVGSFLTTTNSYRRLREPITPTARTRTTRRKK